MPFAIPSCLLAFLIMVGFQQPGNMGGAEGGRNHSMLKISQPVQPHSSLYSGLPVTYLIQGLPYLLGYRGFLFSG